MIASVLMVISTIVRLFLMQWEDFPFCPCQEARSSLNDGDVIRGTKKIEVDTFQKDKIREKGDSLEDLWKCRW